MISASNPSLPATDGGADVDADVDAELQYFNAVRMQVDAFVARQFGWRGTIRLHGRALGWDILRAPVNLILSPALVLTRLLGWLCAMVRLNGAARWLRARRIVLRTAVAADVEASVVRHLFQIPLPQGETCNSGALSRVILEAPQFRRALCAKTGVAGAAASADRIASAIAEYSSARSAVADMTTALIALVIGALVFQAVTPGAISMAPNMAKSMAFETAVAGFPLGQGMGSIWYRAFSPGAAPWLVAANIAGLVMVGSVIGAFAGVIADPVQARLGLHRRRLLRFLDAIEDDLVGSGTKRYAAREHVYARLVDIWDAGASVLRVFRS